MLLRRFKVGATWERIAALQQIIISRAVYTNNPTAITGAFAPDVQLVIFQPPIDSQFTWPPGFCLLKSGDNYFLNVAGTTSARQAGGHIWGSLVLSGSPGDTTWNTSTNGAPNYAWASVWNDMKQRIRDAIPLPWTGKKLSCFGHSYGAAVAAIAGRELKTVAGFDTEIMTIAAPKIWTVGEVAGLPSTYWRIESTNDLVTTMPHGSDWCPVVVKSDFVRDYAYPVRSFLLRWEHQGQQILLQPDGTEGTAVPERAVWPEFVADSYFASHFTANYFGRVRANAIKVGAL